MVGNLAKFINPLITRLTSFDRDFRQAACHMLVSLVPYLPYVAQKEFLDKNCSILTQTEFRELLYQFINAYCLRKNKPINGCLEFV